MSGGLCINLINFKYSVAYCETPDSAPVEVIVPNADGIGRLFYETHKAIGSISSKCMTINKPGFSLMS